MYLGRYGERILLTFILGIQIVQAKKILKYIPDSGLSRFPLGVSVCRSNTSTAAELAEIRKITTFYWENTIFNEHPVLTFNTCSFCQISSTKLAVLLDKDNGIYTARSKYLYSIVST